MTPKPDYERLSQFIWETRYRESHGEKTEHSLEDTWDRVSQAVAAVEQDSGFWAARFREVLGGFRFLPGGRILAGAGTQHAATLANCFVMGPIEDSIAGIFESLKEAALTMQQGGGIGCDFSTLRPRGSRAGTTGTIASGPVSFMRVWDATCATVMSTGVRRGAMMATLRCDHTAIEEFIDAKRSPDALPHFNLSVLVTNAFMQAVHEDARWSLVFPPNGSVYKSVRARDIWQRLCESAYDCAEPGVLFVDRINAANNLGYCEELRATNPCGEAPLPAYGACVLGSINLAALIQRPFEPEAQLDCEALRRTVRVAVRFLDNAIEISRYPLFRQGAQAQRTRRIGLGITGLADALAMLNLRYDSEAAHAMAAQAMRVIRDCAYEASIELAQEKGPFPALDRELYLSQPFIHSLPQELRSRIAVHGIRNSHLLAIAPAGSISLLANNVSSGVEPIVGLEMLRKVRGLDGAVTNFQVTDYAYALWRSRQSRQADLPPGFVTAERISARDHLLMQAAVNPFIDGAIAKTVSLPRDAARSSADEIFRTAHTLGLKGCTIFQSSMRPSVVEGGTGLENLWSAASDVRCTRAEADSR
jgi:ribonucleoside-diphosphate reductase alpha chain